MAALRSASITRRRKRVTNKKILPRSEPNLTELNSSSSFFICSTNKASNKKQKSIRCDLAHVTSPANQQPSIISLNCRAFATFLFCFLGFFYKSMIWKIQAMFVVPSKISSIDCGTAKRRLQVTRDCRLRADRQPNNFGKSMRHGNIQTFPTCFTRAWCWTLSRSWSFFAIDPAGFPERRNSCWNTSTSQRWAFRTHTFDTSNIA